MVLISQMAWPAAGVATLHEASPCSTKTLAHAVPGVGTGVQLASYSYCSGTLNATAFVENTNYNKIVRLYYTNSNGVVTPLSILQLGYAGDVPGASGWENWIASAQYANLDGVQRLVNITYQDLDAPRDYSQILNEAVTASGPTPTTSSIPRPYATPSGFAGDITNYTLPNAASHVGVAKSKLFANVFPNGTVIAAQSFVAPDYAFDWVRDSSLTFDVIEQFYEAASGEKKSLYASLLFNYAKGRVSQQLDPNLQTGLGEPKFNLDGRVFTGPWGRPQNDGPASTSITLLNFANAFLKAGGPKKQIMEHIWDSSRWPGTAPVKRDLFFIASNWTAPSFDAWEEVESDHLYNKLVQHRALRLGAQFARSVNDSSAASSFAAAASAIEDNLPIFWDNLRNLILYSYGPVINNKYSYKDIAVLLGINHGYNNDSIYAPTDDKVLATAVQIATCFLPVYSISSKTKNAAGLPLAPPVGRYPEDVYDGVATSQGNPWYMTTATVAEYLYRTALSFQSSSSITVSEISLPFWTYFAPIPGGTYGSSRYQINHKYTGRDRARMLDALHGWGDTFLRTVQYYTPPDKRLSEEFNRETGLPRGAADLTWSYASLLSAAMARSDVKGDKLYRSRLANL
ncbi:hypothetical protein FH972_025655 [Carpinus fangiana]|uniref:glucan 1,4-alpha-glucosidase n=1 Tax=Carpinus fangiana TaxID=176857 RepID=A0A5N6L482_9ROSI|nr:hypothetical protein FH972_025655 [Carpinus fangiana]